MAGTKRKKKKTHGGARPGAGRPRKFGEPGIGRTIHMDSSFWSLLDGLGERIGGSRSDAFIHAIFSPDLVRKMKKTMVRKTIIKKKASNGVGRPRKFVRLTVARSLRMPESFWSFMDDVEWRIDGSRSDAVIHAMSRPSLFLKMQKILKCCAA